MIVSYIDKKIQAELEKRRRSLARESDSPLEMGRGGTRQFNKYSSRTPYVVMATNLKPAEFNVAIGGGPSFNPSAYKRANAKSFKKDEIEESGLVNYMHGFRNDGTGAYKNTKSRGISPVPGIKDISVEYKGGYKGIREATVNWAVSNLEDLEFYTPHFLAIGRSVALEWGWIMFNTPAPGKFITYDDSAIQVKDELFKNPFTLITAAGGNLDGIGGVITNFNFKLRDDGGFDCTTTLSALGVNFFGGVGVDSSGEVGLGSILSEKDIVIISKSDTVDEKKEKEKEALLKIDNKDHTNIIEELLNLPGTLGELVRNAKDRDEFGVADHLWWPKESKLKNFFKYNHYLGGVRVTNFMIRWGWLEDNVFSKYTAAISADGKDILFKFRSIDENGESIKISHNEHLTPINPFRSMIFSDSIYDTIAGGDYKSGYDVGRDDSDWHHFEAYFKKYMSLCKDPETTFNHSSINYGKMRNIYVSVTEVMEAFGIDGDYASTLVNFTTLIGTVNEQTHPNYANSDKISPLKTMESAINTLLKKISRNFHNYWKFAIVSNTETADNIRIIDENYVAPDPTDGPDQIITYTAPDTLGIYKFPSFTDGSTVKSQTLEFKIPDAMKTVAMYGTNKTDTETPADPLMRKFKALGVINKNPFLKAGSSGSKHMLSDLKRPWNGPDGHKFGLAEATGSKKLTLTGNTYGKVNTLKYIKVSEDPNSNSSNSSKQARGGTDTKNPGFVRWRKDQEYSAVEGTEAKKYQNSLKDKRAYYIVDETANNVVLKAKAITSLRSSDYMGLTSETNKSYLLPAEFGLEIDGIGGIKPGNICHTDYIQKIYNVASKDGGPSTFFQIFNITQKVSDDGWTTSLETKMRINGNAMGTLYTGGDMNDFMDMEFGTTVEDRGKSKTQADVKKAIELQEEGVAIEAEARASASSAAELSRADADIDIEFEDSFDQAELDAEMEALWDFDLPVITFAKGHVEFEGSAEQNTILYEARPDLREKEMVFKDVEGPQLEGDVNERRMVWTGEYIVASFDVRKKAWDELHTRDAPESIVATTTEVAQGEAAQIAVDDKKVITDAEPDNGEL
jgi:hypothetical protein